MFSGMDEPPCVCGKTMFLRNSFRHVNRGDRCRENVGSLYRIFSDDKRIPLLSEEIEGLLLPLLL